MLTKATAKELGALTELGKPNQDLSKPSLVKHFGKKTSAIHQTIPISRMGEGTKLLR
jgi:hypothetical protein